MRIPVLKANAVYHIGTLDKTLKGVHFRDSFEGHCLSVSRCPLAWRGIARLGGLPLWALTKQGALFLDLHRVEDDASLRDHIETWGLTRGYAERKTLWRAWLYDSESDAWRYMLCLTEAEAAAEVDEAVGPDDGPAVEPVEALVGTPALCERVGLRRLDNQDAFDFLAMAWAEDMQPDIDGVWWTEMYAPLALSAPRGGIFPSRLPRWAMTESSFALVTDDEDGENMVTGHLEAGA